jgi:hypothetical protein
MLMTAISVKSRLLSDGFRTEAHRRCRVAEEGFHLYSEVNVLDHRVKCFTNMFYILKNLLLLNLVNVKPICNNLIFNKTLSLYTSYVCLLHSRFIENHPI